MPINSGAAVLPAAVTLIGKTRASVYRNHDTQVDATDRERRPCTQPNRTQKLRFCRRDGGEGPAKVTVASSHARVALDVAGSRVQQAEYSYTGGGSDIYLAVYDHRRNEFVAVSETVAVIRRLVAVIKFAAEVRSVVCA